MWEIFPQKLLAAYLMWGQWKPQVTVASCCSSGQREKCTKCTFTPEVFQPIRGQDWDSEPIRGGDNFKKISWGLLFSQRHPNIPHAISGNSQIWHLIGFHPRDHSNILISTNSDHCFYDWPACLQAPLVLDDQVIFCLTVSLDKLPASTLKAKVRNI